MRKKLISFAAFVFLYTPSYAERRVALVVGNAAYQHATKLANPLNDARDVKAKLEALGFEVVHGEDLTGDGFDRLVQTFVTKASGADLALFFYAGHGVQFDGSNYLVPVDMRVDGAYTLQRKAVPAQAVMEQMERAAKVSLVFLDACRNNTLMRDLEQSLPEQTRSLASARGLARMEPKGANSLIAFATAPNTVAADGTGRNSPFTAALLKHIDTEGVVLQEMLTDITADVVRATDGKQKPEVLSRLTSKVWLKQKVVVATPVPLPVPPVPVTPPVPSREREASVAWDSLKASCDRGALDLFRTRYGDTFFGDLAARRVSAIDAAQECKLATPPIPSPPSLPKLTEDESLVRDLQAGLSRVGCYDGRADGKWGAGSRAALAAYFKHSKAEPEIEPSRQTLDAIRNRSVRVCPLQCGSDEVEVNDNCEKKPTQPKAKNDPALTTTAPRVVPPKDTPTTMKSGGRPHGVDVNGSQWRTLVPCDSREWTNPGDLCRRPSGIVCSTMGNGVKRVVVDCRSLDAAGIDRFPPMAAAQLYGSGMHFTIGLRAVVVGIAVAILFASTAARAERRVALVVGNGAYAHATRLNNPGNDARDMAERLGRLGFDVVQALDVGSEAFDGAVSTFARKLVGADLALFFYAGHGLQFNGVNYLLPVDTKIEGEYALRRKAVLAQEVIDQMERAAKVSLVFLDACRNNTLLRDLEQSLPEQSRSTASQRGLARMDPRGTNTLIAFATAPNEVAADGTGRNSPFSAALLKHIETANVSVQDMLTSVAGDVLGATNGRQKPAVLSRLSTKVVLLEKVTPLPPPVVIPLPPVATPSKEREASVAWDTLKTSCDRGALDLFRIRYGDTFFGDLAARRVSSIDSGQECASRPAPPVTRAATYAARVSSGSPCHRLPLGRCLHLRDLGRGRIELHAVDGLVSGLCGGDGVGNALVGLG